MEKIVCASILLFHTTGRGSEVSNLAVAEAKRTDLKSDTEEPRAKLRLYGDNVEKLEALRVDVSQLLATYDRPLTTKEPFTFQYFRKIGKKSTTAVNRKSTNLRTRRTNYVFPRTYPSMEERRDAYYTHFLNTFSFYNNTMKQTLLSMKNETKKGDLSFQCFQNTFSAFRTRCTYRYYSYGGLKKMKGLLNQICSSGWMTIEQILHIIQTCCQQRFKFDLFEINVKN